MITLVNINRNNNKLIIIKKFDNSTNIKYIKTYISKILNHS